MDYETWKVADIPEMGKGCFNCKDKFCNGEQCEKFLNFRLKLLKELLPQAANNHRKEHLLTSIMRTENKLEGI